MNILIVGGNSAIAQAAGRIWAARGARLALAGRARERLEPVAASLRAAGAAQVELATVTMTDPLSVATLVARAPGAMGPPATLLVPPGPLADPDRRTPAP